MNTEEITTEFFKRRFPDLDLEFEKKCGYFDTWKERYIDNIKKSDIHTKEFLDGWFFAHITGNYPKKIIQIETLPRILLEHFGFNKDMFYFSNRNIEVKNTVMVKQWADYFKPKSVLDLGCGKGCYLYFWKWYCDTCKGIELSQWAVDNAFCNDIQQGDISEAKNYYYSDLITAIDVLEHLTNEQLDKTLKNMFDHGYRFLFSIPYKGDPNLLADKTHKQFMTMQEWITKIESYGIKIKLPPQDWLYAHQLLIGEKQ